MYLRVAAAAFTLTLLFTMGCGKQPEPRTGHAGADLALSGFRKKNAMNLRQIALAIHNYASTYDKLPPCAFSVPGEKPLLSWRVALLPFLEQRQLFKSFKLDERWDSPHNKKLIEQMPEVFALPGVEVKQPGLTHYRMFTGPNTLYPRFPDSGQSTFTIALPDGTSTTIFVVEAAEPVVWSKPDEFPFERGMLPALGALEPGLPQVVMGDGRVVTLDTKKIGLATFTSLITPAGGEIIPDDFDKLRN
ncbi:MAG: DUF1559 domain-containing protein [Gemmataceae bacterium]